jgi:cullin 3
MAKAELCRTLQTLACAKYKLLTKIPKGREVDETDSFTYNTAFSCPLAKIKIQTVANKVETSEESKETEDKVDKGRDTLCDVRPHSNRRIRAVELTNVLSSQACIVRVMKDRKFLTHTELVNTVIVQLAGRFLPRPAMVKKAIERLIEKEYLMRDESDRHKLRYVVSPRAMLPR